MSNDPFIGRVLADRYRIVAPLGEGGMGRVYLAEHVKMGRKSAVKLMSPGLALSADAIGRFHREAANASRINHPNVASIYDFGEGEGGVLYLAMELIEGETLSALIRREGRLPVARAASLIKQAADALSAAHHLGIVHRDLKPDNIMLARHVDGSDWLKVVDFGIAKTTESSGRGSQTVTTAGVSIGTPDYMSPEQLAGDRLDARTDLYSLGLVLFNMLTGELPYPRLTSKETLVRRLTAPPRTLAEVRPEIAWPPALQRALDGALAPETHDRFPDVATFGRAVMDAVSDGPGGATTAPISTARTVRLPAGRVGGSTVPVAESGATPRATAGHAPDGRATARQPAAAGAPAPRRRGSRAAVVSAIAVVAALAFVALRPRAAQLPSPRDAIATSRPTASSANGDSATERAAADAREGGSATIAAPEQAGTPRAERAAADSAPVADRRAAPPTASRPHRVVAAPAARLTSAATAGDTASGDTASSAAASLSAASLSAPTRERADAALSTLQRAAVLFGAGDARGARTALREAQRDGAEFRQQLAGAPVPTDIEQRYRTTMREVVDSCQAAKFRRASPELAFVRCEALVQRPAGDGNAPGADSGPAAGLRARRLRFRRPP